MSTEKITALIAEARDALIAGAYEGQLVDRLADALEASVQAPADPYCREESCRYRHWTSGPMPTHRRGAHCPEPPLFVRGEHD